MKKLIFIFLLFSLFIFGCSSDQQDSVNDVIDDSSSEVNEEGGNDLSDYIAIPLSDISDEVVKYSLKSGSTDVVYFAVKGTDGEIRTAFDACDVCGGYEGYRQTGDDVTCNKCGRVFSIADIGSKNQGGGCWPSYLDNKIEGDQLLISKSEIEKGAFRFK